MIGAAIGEAAARMRDAGSPDFRKLPSAIKDLIGHRNEVAHADDEFPSLNDDGKRIIEQMTPQVIDLMIKNVGKIGKHEVKAAPAGTEGGGDVNVGKVGAQDVKAGSGKAAEIGGGAVGRGGLSLGGEVRDVPGDKKDVGADKPSATVAKPRSRKQKQPSQRQGATAH
jgi:hypothetical protein